MDTTLAPGQVVSVSQGAVDLSCENATLLVLMGNYISITKRYDVAVPFFERALELNPNDLRSIYITLAQIYKDHFHDLQKAIVTLERYIKNCQFDSEYKSVLQMLQEKKQKLFFMSQ